MKCPVCNQYFDRKTSNSFMKEKLCPGCETSLIRPVPILDVIYSFLIVVFLTPLFYYLLTYIKASLWKFFYTTFFILTTSLVSIFPGKHEKLKVYKMRIFKFIIYFAIFFFFFFQVERLADYTLQRYH